MRRKWRLRQGNIEGYFPTLDELKFAVRRSSDPIREVCYESSLFVWRMAFGDAECRDFLDMEEEEYAVTC